MAGKCLQIRTQYFDKLKRHFHPVISAVIAVPTIKGQ